MVHIAQQGAIIPVTLIFCVQSYHTKEFVYSTGFQRKFICSCVIAIVFFHVILDFKTVWNGTYTIYRQYDMGYSTELLHSMLYKSTYCCITDQIKHDSSCFIAKSPQECVISTNKHGVMSAECDLKRSRLHIKYRINVNFFHSYTQFWHHKWVPQIKVTSKKT